VNCRKHAYKYFVTYLFGFGVVIFKDITNTKFKITLLLIVFALFLYYLWGEIMAIDTGVKMG
jgi:hypothetical protein